MKLRMNAAYGGSGTAHAEMMERVQRALSAELEDMMMNRGQEADECAWINRAFEKINHGDAA